MQRSKHLSSLVAVILAILLLHLSAFADEQKKKAIIGDGWKLELTDALLTKEIGNVVVGGLHALPDKSILILYFNVKYINEARKIESIEKIVEKNAVILDAITGKPVTCPSFEKIESSFSTERGKGTDSETRYTLSPSIGTATKKGQVTRVFYTVCVNEKNKNLLFVIPNVGKIELETLIQERESLWQGPRPDSPLYPEKAKD